MIKSYLNGKAIVICIHHFNQSKINYTVILRKVGAHNSSTHNTHFGQTILGVAYEFMKHEIHMHDQFVST